MNAEFEEKFPDSSDPEKFQAMSVGKTLPKNIWETYSAFANTFGGTIVLGASWFKVSGQYEVSGVTNPDRIIREFWAGVNNPERISATLLKKDDVVVEIVDALRLIRITVPRAERSLQPVYIDGNRYGGTFRRKDGDDHHCNTAEVNSMISDSKDDITDLEVMEGMDLSVLNMDTINIFRAHLKAQNQRHPWVDVPVEQFLTFIGASTAMTNSVYRPTAAGLLMFGNEYSIVKKFPSYSLEYYEGNIEENEVSDRVTSMSGEWSGNVFDFYLLIADRMISGPGGKKSPETGEIGSALDKTLVSSLVNADYYGKGGVVIERTKNSVRIAKAGLFRISVDRIFAGEPSDDRNKAMARMFRLIGLYDASDRYLRDAIGVWEKNGFPEPVMTETVYPSQSVILMMMDHESLVISSENGLYADVLRLIKTDGNTTALTISKELDISKRHAERLIADLRLRGKIKRVGNNRSGQWIIV